MLPAVNQVHISVRLRAGSTPGKRRIGEGVTSQTNQCQRFDVFIHSGVKATFGGDGEVYFSLCLSGCHLCFNLLLYFSKPNREILRFFFYASFPFLPHRSPAFLCILCGGICYIVSPSCTAMGLVSHIGYLMATLACTFQAGWLFLWTISFPFLSLCCGSELAEAEKTDCKSKGICCFNWEGLGNRQGSQYPVTQCGEDSSIPPSQVFKDLWVKRKRISLLL